MALSTVQIGRIGQAYAKKEAAYATAETLAASNAFRHKALTFPGSDVKNKRMITEKQQSPFALSTQMTDGRTSASFNLSAILRPSGTINTLPELDPFLECAFGSKVNTALSTTVASSGVVGGATLTSSAGLAVGGALLITCPDGKKRVRVITTLPGADAVTWAPELPAGQSPANSAAVKSALVYKLTQQNLLSLTIAHYLKNTDASAGLSRVLAGAVVDKFALSLDANDDPIVTLSGPGSLLSASPAAQPGGFTMVGSQPPSGITGELVLVNAAGKFMKAQIDLTNGLIVRNDEYGKSAAAESYRAGRGEVTCAIDARAESQTLYDLAAAGTNAGVFIQTGFTEGNILAVRMPNVLFSVPDTDDPDEEVNFPFKGKALETSDAAYDALQLVLA